LTLFTILDIIVVKVSWYFLMDFRTSEIFFETEVG
jgi:hypothetical protein